MRHVISNCEVKRGMLGLIVLMATLSAGLSNAFADGEKADATATIPATAPAPATTPATSTATDTDTKGLPMPLHTIEGVGGTFSVPSAYLVNPARKGDIFGLPSAGGIYVDMGHGKSLEAFTLTETLWDRLELGYGFDQFNLGDFPQAVQSATGMKIGEQSVDLHNVNARLLLVKEGAFDQSWVPAVTFGTEYKYNETVNQINSDLHGTLRSSGIKDNEGVDFTLHATKMITVLPRPIIVTAGLRSTEAAQMGLLGFTDERRLVGEGSVCVLATDKLVFCAEYRQNPNDYKPIPGLLAPEADWWTVCAAYILSKHASIAAGYAHFGYVLNHEANDSFGVAFKYEF
jgi:hypothetical protein